MSIIFYDKEGQVERKRKGAHTHTDTHTCACTQHLVSDLMIIHYLYFKYSQQQHFYNR